MSQSKLVIPYRNKERETERKRYFVAEKKIIEQREKEEECGKILINVPHCVIEQKKTRRNTSSSYAHHYIQQ
jgi:hypothetical protein